MKVDSLKSFSNSPCNSQNDKENLPPDFLSSLKKCIGLLAEKGERGEAEQLEMIRSSVLALTDLKQRKLYLLSVKEEIIDILQSLIPQRLQQLQSEKFVEPLQQLLEISLISSQILHNQPERIYPEHQVFFAALFRELVKMGQIHRARQIRRSFINDADFWKQRAACEGIAAGMREALAFRDCPPKNFR